MIKCVLHIFWCLLHFLAICVLSLYLSFISRLPGCKRLCAPAYFAHIPQMTHKSQNNKLLCNWQMHSMFFIFKPRVKSSGFWWSFWQWQKLRENETTEAVDELFKISSCITVTVLVVCSNHSHSIQRKWYLQYVAVSSAKVQIKACVQRLTSSPGYIA